MTALIAGFSVGFSLILAIGAQNAFVLRQGLRRSHVFAVALTCSLSDALLIVLGVPASRQFLRGCLKLHHSWFGLVLHFCSCTAPLGSEQPGLGVNS